MKEDYLISDIIYETKSRWDYDQLSEENDFMIQKVAEILKDEPQALSICDGSTILCQGEIRDGDSENKYRRIWQIS